MRDRFQAAAWLAGFIIERPGLRRGTMFGRPAAFVGRHLLVCAWEQGLVCRLPPDALETALRGRQGRRFKVDGRAMKGWIEYRPQTMTAADALQPTLEVAARALAHSSKGGCPCGRSTERPAPQPRTTRSATASKTFAPRARANHPARVKPAAPRTRRAR